MQGAQLCTLVAAPIDPVPQLCGSQTLETRIRHMQHIRIVNYTIRKCRYFTLRYFYVYFVVINVSFPTGDTASSVTERP